MAGAGQTKFVSQWTTWMLVAAGALVLGAAILKDKKLEGPALATRVSLPKLGGGRSEFAPGKVTVIDFWATWCAPCRVSMPKIQKLWQDYLPRGVELLSIDTDDESNDREPAVQEFLIVNKLTFPVAMDDGSAQSAFKVANLPTLLVVGKDGHVVWRRIGALSSGDERDLRVALEDALAAR